MRQFRRTHPRPAAEIPNRIHEIQVAPQLLSDQHGVSVMIVAAGLAIFVVVCLLLSMVQTPPAIGR
jgi:hypothetical protein